MDIPNVTVTLTVPSDRLADLQRFCAGELQQAAPAEQPTITSVDTTAADQQEEKPKKPRKPRAKKPKKEAEAAEQEPKPEPEPSARMATTSVDEIDAHEEIAAEAEHPSEDALRAAVKEAVVNGELAKVQAAFAKVKAEAVSDVKPEDRATVIAAIEAD